jgi:hypothetical protein
VDKTAPPLVLPIQATGRVDVGRLLHEVGQIDNFLRQAAIREPGTPMKLPKTSRLLDEFVDVNKLNLLHDADRARALNFLITVKAKAPVLHMSFGVDPAPIFVGKLTSWLRREIHPLVLLQIGLQPTIGAGCVVRTTNKYFDLSLREHFKKQRPLLINKLHGDVQPAIEAAPTEPTLTQDPALQQLSKEVAAALAATDHTPQPATHPPVPGGAAHE